MFCCCAAEPGPANEMPFGGSEEKFRDAFVKTAPAMASPDFIPVAGRKPDFLFSPFNPFD